MVCEMTHLYMWHDTLMYVTWLIYIYNVTHGCTWYDSFIHMTRRIDIRDMTHSHIWRDLLIYLRWLMNICDVMHSYVPNFYFCEWRLIKVGLGICQTNTDSLWDPVTKYFIEFVAVKTKKFVSSNVNMILTRQTCGQRSVNIPQRYEGIWANTWLNRWAFGWFIKELSWSHTRQNGVTSHCCPSKKKWHMSTYENMPMGSWADV